MATAEQSRWRWRRVLVAVVLIATGAFVALLAQHREAPVRVLSLEPLPPPVLDLGDDGNRIFLSWLSQSERVPGLRPERTLFYRCWAWNGNGYARSLSHEFGPSSYLEIQRNGAGTDATALYWHDQNLPVSPASARRKPRAAPIPRQHPVSATDLAAIEAAFLALAHGKVDAVRDVDLFRGKNVVLEFCRNGKYAVFARTDFYSEEDDPVLVLAEQMRAAAGVAPEKPPAGMYGM